MRCCKTLVLLLFLAIPSYVTAGTEKEAIVFKDVVTAKPCKMMRGYICGTEAYPDYDASDLPVNYGIKASPAIIIPSNAIVRAKILKLRLGKWENWTLSIRFTDKYGKQLKKYTINKKGNMVAMLIGAKLAAIAPLASDLDSEMQITSTKDRIERIKNLLVTIYPQITTEIQTSP